MFSIFRRFFSSPANVANQKAETQAHSSDADAQFRTGLRMACGKGETPDYEKAAQWYTQAAEQDHALAQFNLAVMYAQGQGVARDDDKSLMWMNRSARLGDAGAQYRLGMRQYLACRDGGAGAKTEQRIEALKWVRLSAAQGYRGAEGACEFVALGMTKEEVAEGGRRAGAFGSSR